MLRDFSSQHLNSAKARGLNLFSILRVPKTISSTRRFDLTFYSRVPRRPNQHAYRFSPSICVLAWSKQYTPFQLHWVCACTKAVSPAQSYTQIWRNHRSACQNDGYPAFWGAGVARNRVWPGTVGARSRGDLSYRFPAEKTSEIWKPTVSTLQQQIVKQKEKTAILRSFVIGVTRFEFVT